MADTFVCIMPDVNTFYFSDATNNIGILDHSDYRGQILGWQYKSFYTAKATTTDPITIMAHTQFLGTEASPTLHICDRNLKEITAITSDLNAISLPTGSYFKGSQNISGFSWTDPFTGTVIPLLSTLWNFSFANFSSYLTPNTPLSYYYLRLDTFDTSGNLKSYYSEPIWLCDNLPNTLLFQCYYQANKALDTNVITAGWSTNLGSPPIGQPYTPSFCIRCEGYILPLDNKAVNVGYLQQLYEQQQVFTQKTHYRTLQLGEISRGIPDYMLQKMTELLLSDNWSAGADINSQYSYILYNASSQTTPGDIWKSKRDNNRPLLYASTVISPRYLAQRAMVDPTPGVPHRFHSDRFSGRFS